MTVSLECGLSGTSGRIKQTAAVSEFFRRLNGCDASAMLPFTDLSVDVALGADRTVLPRARCNLLL